MSASRDKLMRRLIGAAEFLADGHLTIMKFNSNWRVGLRTPNTWEEIQTLPSGATFEEAAMKALNIALHGRTGDVWALHHQEPDSFHSNPHLFVRSVLERKHWERQGKA